MKPQIDSLEIPDGSGGVLIKGRRMTFRLCGTFPGNVHLGNVIFAISDSSIGTMGVDSLSTNDKTTIAGYVAYNPKNGGYGTLTVTVTDPNDLQTSEKYTVDNVTFPP